LLADGGPTAHYLANRLQQFPLALIAVAATNAVFPALFALGHRGERVELAALHRRTQRSVLFFALPATFGLFALAGPVVAACYGHGAFGASGIERTTLALRALTLAIVPAGAVGLVARTYYALGDMRWPVVSSAIALVVNAVLNVALVVGLGMDVEGLALATAFSSWLHLGLLVPGLRTRHGLPAPTAEQRARWRGALARMLAAALASAMAGYAVEAAATPYLSAAGGLALGIGTAAAVHLGLAHAFGLPEVRTLTERLRRRSR
jgi:putative peptidoglycan lipid II flippase